MKEQLLIFSAFFGIVLFLSSPGFGNPAFALSFFIALLILFIGIVILKYIKLDKKTLKNLLLISAISVLVSSFWLFHSIPSMKEGVESLNTTNQTNLGWALRAMGNPLSYAFGLNHFSKDYFPFNFPYSDSSFFKNLFILLSFTPIVFSVFYFRKIKMFKDKKLFLLSLLVFLVLISLNAKINIPFEKVNYFFYNIWGMNTLRAYDKIAILIPFFLSLLVLISANYLEKTGHKKKAILILVIILLMPLPFYAGKLQQTMSMRYANLSAKNKNYQKSKLTFLVKIPSEYYQIQDKLKTDSEKSFIATLPNNLGDTGTGSSNYPKWKLNGVDPTQFLYGKPFIEANFQYIPDWYFSKTFNELSENPAWLPELLGMMDSKYIIFHKDAPDESVEKTLPKMRVLEKDGSIKILEENDYFILYEIDEKYRLPYLTYQKETFDWRNDPVWIGRNAERIITSSKGTDFREINPKKFEIDFENSDFSNNIILAEKFHPLWKAYAIRKDGKKWEIKDHFLARGYANGWKIENPEEIDRIIIEYYPIKLMWWGIWISGATVLFLLIYLLKYYYDRHHPRLSH